MEILVVGAIGAAIVGALFVLRNVSVRSGPRPSSTLPAPANEGDDQEGVWRTSSSGNQTLRLNGYRVTVFERNGSWKYCAAEIVDSDEDDDPYFSPPHMTEAQAQSGAMVWIDVCIPRQADSAGSLHPIGEKVLSGFRSKVPDLVERAGAVVTIDDFDAIQELVDEWRELVSRLRDRAESVSANAIVEAMDGLETSLDQISDHAEAKLAA